MPQITAGKAIVVNGSTHVVAEDSTVDWSTVGASDIFTVPASTNSAAYANGAIYYVVSTTAPGSSGSGKWELTISAGFGKPSGTVFYAITTDFWPVTGAPRAKAGDVDIRLLLDQAIGILDTFLGSVGGGGTTVPSHSKTISGGDVGAVTVAMVFSPALSTPPAFVGNPVIIKPNPSDDNVTVLTIDSITASGYNVNLSAPIPAGYIIKNNYIEAS